jgi:hypothetical protein
MSQKSSDPQAISFVSQPLKRDSIPSTNPPESLKKPDMLNSNKFGSPFFTPASSR